MSGRACRIVYRRFTRRPLASRSSSSMSWAGRNCASDHRVAPHGDPAHARGELRGRRHGAAMGRRPPDDWSWPDSSSTLARARPTRLDAPVARMMGSWPSVCSICSRSASGRRPRTPSARCAPPAPSPTASTEDGLLDQRDPGAGRAVRLARRHRTRARQRPRRDLGLLGERPETVDIATAARPARRRARSRARSSCWATAGRASVRTISSCTGAELALPPQRDAFFAYDDGDELRARADVLLGRRRLRRGRDRGRRRPDQARRHRPALSLPTRRRAAGPVRARPGLPISGVMLANELVVAAPRPRSAPGCCDIWAVMQECVMQRLFERGDAARRAEGAAPARRSCTGRLRDEPVRRGSAAGHGLGQPVRPRGERGERGRRPGGDRADQRRGRHLPAVLHYYARFVPGASDDGVVRFLLVRRRDRRALQGERVDLRRRGGLPGRGRLGLLDGGRSAVRGARRHARAGRERRRDRHGTQPRADLRPGRRAGSGAVHRAQRDGGGEGDQRRADRPARRRPSTSSAWTR